MKINVCTIDKNCEEGRQTIYWDSEDKLLHSELEPEADTGYQCQTLEDAADTAYALWSNGWNYEWIEYGIKPEHLDQWGPDAYTDTVLTAREIGAFARGWEMDATEVMDQLEER